MQDKGFMGAPPGFTLASMTVHGWVAYARRQINSRLTVDDIFPAANNALDWEEASLLSKSIFTEEIKQVDGGTLKKLRVLSVQASDNSVWLGDKLHVTDRDGRAQLQIRKDTIPVYLAGLGVDAADVTALGTTIATATLDNWVQLSTDAGGSDQLSAIFPVVNQSADFELRTTVNELLVKPG